jgi:hypothetical protein
MANTWTKISSGILSGGGVTIGSIPQTYTDLALISSARDNYASTGSNWIRVRFNGDATAVYSTTLMNASSGTAVTSRVSGDTVGYAGWINYGNNTAGTFASNSMYIPNYTNTTGFKTYTTEGMPDWASTTGVFNHVIGGLWRSTAAISSLVLYPVSDFNTLSTYTLYGIKRTA